MLLKHLQEKQKKLQQKNNFYTPSGLSVYFKEPLLNDDINVERVVAKIEDTIPDHLRSEIEMIIFGQFDEFEERSLNAFYKDGALYVSNVQDSEEDLYDDLVHEISHSIEEVYGYEIYADQKVRDEFLRKRKFMHDLLWAKGYKAPLSFFLETEYNKEFDMFLYEDIGYDVLNQLLVGLFISAYGATSLREYFATGFVEYYIDPSHEMLKKISPELYKKFSSLEKPEELDIDA
ncbi:hypothetical protein CMI37_14115 [Candidatus Pacearchaeota archaeon]|nr:hypothetical protein [Candidatus Pacearchaeota archaeon]